MAGLLSSFGANNNNNQELQKCFISRKSSGLSINTMSELIELNHSGRIIPSNDSMRRPIYPAIYLLLINFFLITLQLRAAEVQTESKSAGQSESLPLYIKNNWQFCPVQNYQPELDIAVLNCQPIQLPNGWETVFPDYDGFGILHSQFSLPESTSSDSLGISISRIRDADKLFINGHLIGATGEFPPNFDKAVLYSRLYVIPTDILHYDRPNHIRIWIYNDARPGGLTQTVPVINDYFHLLNQFHQENYQFFAFIMVLLVFALLHFVYYLFHLKAIDNLYYSIFLFAWCAYIYVYSNLSATSGLSMSLLFRLNVASFFVIFAFLPLFIYRFFNQELPLFLRLIVGLSLALIPLCFLLPQPHLVYYPLELVELLTIPAVTMVFWMLFRSIRAKLKYAKTMSAVLVLYIVLGTFDILVDYTQTDNFDRVKLFGPWALLLLSFVLTLIISHKNLVYYKNATIDKLTGALRFTEFQIRLEDELLRADREKKHVVIIMIDLDNFKSINDSYGHLQGDYALQIISKSIRVQLRQFDLFCRFGGDEFCVAAALDHKNEISTFVERIQQSINSLVLEIKGDKIQIKATIGVEVREPGLNTHSQVLIESADQRLVKGKANFKGEIYW